MIKLSASVLFQSTPPARGATSSRSASACRCRDFNPRPPRGGRLYIAGYSPPIYRFQSTPPARGATFTLSILRSTLAFQSTPPARGATAYSRYARLGAIFQSTPPARGATAAFRSFSSSSAISIHAPREGGDLGLEVRELALRQISIHAPREGGDGFDVRMQHYQGIFQSTPPARGATAVCRNTRQHQHISIHAPREGGDSKDAQFYLRIFDKQVELLRFLGKIRGGCLRNPEKDRRFLGKSLANLPEISGHLDFAGGGKARPGYPCAVPLPRRAACVRGSGDPPADRCSSYRNAPLFSHIASLDSKSADCLSQNP